MRYLSEILLEEPRDGVLWKWNSTMKGTNGAGVSKTLQTNLNTYLQLLFLNLLNLLWNPESLAM